MRYVCVRARAIRHDSELAYDGEYDEPSVYYFRDNAVMGSDSEDDDDDDEDDFEDDVCLYPISSAPSSLSSGADFFPAFFSSPALPLTG